MLNLPEKIIIFDTEFTAWAGSLENNWSRPNEYREIVQIGAILVDTEQLIEIDALNLLVKPAKNPILSEYLTNLTGIRQEDIDRAGISFPEAISQFDSWCGSYPIYSYGGDEENIKENCRLLEMPFVFDAFRFQDIKNIFLDHGIAANQYQSGNIMEAFGKKTKLDNHYALNDVRIILEGLRELNSSPSKA